MEQKRYAIESISGIFLGHPVFLMRVCQSKFNYFLLKAFSSSDGRDVKWLPCTFQSKRVPLKTGFINASKLLCASYLIVHYKVDIKMRIVSYCYTRPKLDYERKLQRDRSLE